MRLYSGTSQNFIKDAIHNQIAEKLKNAFFNYYRHNPSPAEINSWRNSLRSVSQVFQYADLNDHGVLLEYQLPLTSRRLDCMICGRDQYKKDRAVIIELKQWDKCEEANGENEVLTWIGGGKREVLHPSVQVGQYQMYLEDTHTAFYEGNAVQLRACTYLHNYNYYSEDVIFASKFHSALEKYPLFTADDVEKLTLYLHDQLLNGAGLDVLRRVEESKYRPNKKLMDHVGNIIRNKSEYILIDEQLVVYDSVLSCAKKSYHDKQKVVIIVKGGPGTGKSVIAINLMADLLLKGYNAHYATGSKAFTETLRKIIGMRGAVQFKYFNSYASADQNVMDVLIADEAHRIRETSNSRFTKRIDRSNKSQIEELLYASKVAVFFIDDHQVVRPNEIGSTEYIKETASKKNYKIFEYELEAQFRCSGSDAFVNWINNTLGVKRTANVIWDQREHFDFKVFPGPLELETAIREKSKLGFTARMTAGFCWDWSLPNEDGTLKDDVIIGNYKRPWDAKPEAKRLAKGIPKASLWAYDPNGINQVGCVYTAQGFEFDYVGVIFGEDLVYDFDHQRWIGRAEKSSDSVVKRSRSGFVDLVKNTYRVLLSRGMKGCYVYFMDKDTERFIKSRMEMVSIDEAIESEVRFIETEVDETVKMPFRYLPFTEIRPFENCVPLFELKAAAGLFSDEQQVMAIFDGKENQRADEFTWVSLPDAFRPQRGLFIAQVIGESMNRRIPNGSWCLFRLKPAGSRQGKVVLVQHREISDAETGGHFTVKVYKSEKKINPDGTWSHTKIVLSPDTTAPGFAPIILTDGEEKDLNVIAELVAVLG
jgi:uncharacterized protein